MDRLSSVMLRSSLIWLLAGFAIGAVMLMDRVAPGDWIRWMAPTHAHMLFVGWFLQFAVGVAYWLLPRRRSAAAPLGYDERVTVAAVAALNLGLILRVVAEPAERTGHASNLTLTVLGLSALFQLAAALIFVGQLWPRLAARPPRKSPGVQRVGHDQHRPAAATPAPQPADRRE